MWWLPLVIVLAMLGVGAYVVWPRREDGPRPTDDPPAPGGTVQPESLEGVLVAQLSAAEITRNQYLRAMAQLAARDDERHPLSVPPEIGGMA